MNKEKFELLVKYLNGLKDRLAGEIPSKHKLHPTTFKNYLLNEIRLVQTKIDQAKLDGIK